MGGVVDVSSAGADPVAALIAAESGEEGAVLSVAVQIFSFSAVVTSFVGFYYGMRGYVKDVLVESSVSSLADDERILAAAVLVPPSILAATDPGLFLPALDAAGTFGITLLFGIIPAACVWRLRQDKTPRCLSLAEMPSSRRWSLSRRSSSVKARLTRSGSSDGSPHLVVFVLRSCNHLV